MTKQIDHFSRRDFLKTSAALGAAWWVGPSLCLGKDARSPLEKLRFACIGVGGKGASDVADAARNGVVAALCDIDDDVLVKQKAAFPDAQVFNDYRWMIELMGDKIDACTISTPDHSHAPATLAAMKKGKHCYTQKPLTWSISEARRLREVAKEMKVATQLGNQGTASSALRGGIEILRAGVLGNVKEVHVWTNRPTWPQGIVRPKGSDKIPHHVHWDLFLGPAPERPFVAGVYHRFNWRGWLDFGTGALGDMGCHIANMSVMGLDLFDPVSAEVVRTSGVVENETYPKFSVIRWHFPQRGKLAPCSLTWYDGQQFPPDELFQGEKKTDNGSLVIGEFGTMYAAHGNRMPPVLLPRERFKDFKPPEPTLPRLEADQGAHFTEFAAACRGGAPGMSNFDYASRLTETVLIGNVALRAGTRIEWDAANMRVKNVPDANRFLSREYRAGWKI